VKPAWLSLPCVALILGFGVWTLMADQPRRPVQIPGSEAVRGDEPVAHDRPLELDRSPKVVNFADLKTAPDRKAPTAPTQAHEGRTGNVVVQFTHRQIFESHVTDVGQEAIFKGRVTTINHSDDQLVSFSVDEIEGELAEDTLYEVRDDAGAVVCGCEPQTAFEYRKGRPARRVPIAIFNVFDQPRMSEITPGFTVHASNTRPVRDGPCVVWSIDGSAESRGRYKLGVRSGDWTYWHPNGVVRAVGKFANDTPTGRWVFWHDNGVRHAVWDSARRDEENEGWQVWAPDGALLLRYDDEYRGMILDAMRAVRERRYGDAKAAFDALSSTLAALPESDERDEFLLKSKRYSGAIANILALETTEERDGQRLLLLFVDYPALKGWLNHGHPYVGEPHYLPELPVTLTESPQPTERR
jgi:hypothetical protein